MNSNAVKSDGERDIICRVGLLVLRFGSRFPGADSLYSNNIEFESFKLRFGTKLEELQAKERVRQYMWDTR